MSVHSRLRRVLAQNGIEVSASHPEKPAPAREHLVLLRSRVAQEIEPILQADVLWTVIYRKDLSIRVEADVNQHIIWFPFIVTDGRRRLGFRQ